MAQGTITVYPCMVESRWNKYIVRVASVTIPGRWYMDDWLAGSRKDSTNMTTLTACRKSWVNRIQKRCI
jgi:hypothetical protein